MSKPDLRNWQSELPYILVYNALRFHDQEAGTNVLDDQAPFNQRAEMWDLDGIPWDLTDHDHRLKLFKLLFRPDEMKVLFPNE